MELEEKTIQQPKRMTAKHALVREILAGSFVRGSAEGEASFVEAGGEKFSRVCIAGTVVEKSEEGGVPFISVFDGTGMVRARAFDERGARALQAINKGADAQVVIGKLRETQERFLAAEAAWPADDLNWESVHLLRAALRKRKALD